MKPEDLRNMTSADLMELGRIERSEALYSGLKFVASWFAKTIFHRFQNARHSGGERLVIARKSY